MGIVEHNASKIRLKIQCSDWEEARAVPGPSDFGSCQVCGTIGNVFSAHTGDLCGKCYAHPSCKFFQSPEGHGGCQLPRRFMCEEWERSQGFSVSGTGPKTGLGVGTSPAPPAGAAPGGQNSKSGPSSPMPIAEPDSHQGGLFGLGTDTGSSGAAKARLGQTGTPRFRPVQSPDSKLEAVPPTLDPAWLESLVAQGIETHLDLGSTQVFLVPERTGQDRFELTYAEGLVLGECVRAFPGARVVALNRPATVVDVDEENDFEPAT